MSITVLALCFMWGIFTTECTLSSFNNKYASFQTLHTVEMKNGAVNLSTRNRRDTGSSSEANHAGSSSKDASINVRHVVLNGTEYSSKAYIHWIGKETSERIFVLTCRPDLSSGYRLVEESQLWRSEDYGNTFHKMSFGPKVLITYFYTFPQDEKKLLFTDIRAKKVYTTDDELASNNSYSVPVEPDIILPHPTDGDQLLLYSLYQKKLYVSTNFAKNWTLLSENVLPNFHWGVKDHDSNVNIVHMEVQGGMPQQAMYKACSVPVCGDEPSPLASVGPFLEGSLTVYQEYMLVQKSNLNGSSSYLAVSHNRQAFQRAYFPGDVKTDDFKILNLDDGQVFVAVNHGNYVNLYLSDAAGQYYVLSFSNIYHVMMLNYFEIDFHEVQGMNWTFIANKRVDSQQGSSAMQTYISYDKGGDWKPLMMNQSCTKTPQCQLLLQIRYLFFMSVLSQENAPGIILAHGNVGTVMDEQQPSIFASNDGGATWKQAPFRGIFRFTMLDQGSVLTAVPDGLTTSHINTTVYYSIDEGNTWSSSEFDKQGVIVKGVVTEPGITTRVESVFGQESRNAPWILIQLNFTSLLPKICGDDDYENWHPKDYNSPKHEDCILGLYVEYKKRKSGAKCYNGEKPIVRIKSNFTCDCTEEDYECDFGYDESDSGCKKATWFNDSYIPAGCDDGGTYNKSKGYRKIPADVCVDTIADKEKFDKVATDCPTAAPLQLSLISETRNIPAGKEVSFHLDQAGGSKFDTVYTWDWGDSSEEKPITGFKQALMKNHTFHKAGHYTVSVTAKNTKGSLKTSVSVHVQDPITETYVMAPWASRTKLPVEFNVLALSHNRMADTDSDHVHFVWKFGDETKGLPLLSWNSSATHVYEKAGKYTVSVEAVNSVSAVYKEISIEIKDDAAILVLTISMELPINLSYAATAQLFMQKVRQQLAEDIGVNLDRLETVIATASPIRAYLYIFPSADSGEITVDDIKQIVIDAVNNHVLGLTFLGSTVTIVSADKFSGVIPDDSGKTSSGPNMKAVYIAAPVLIIVVVMSLVLFLYCRKKVRNIRQYNMLHSQDDSDALLDDDDPPLNLNIDFGTRDSRDESMLDSGGSHLVMVTGGSADNAENC